MKWMQTMFPPGLKVALQTFQTVKCSVKLITEQREINKPMNDISFDDMETVKSPTTENDFVVITEDFLVSGMQSGIGCNNDQLRLLGVEIPAKKGWKQSLIGKRISKETADKFIALKGIHKKADRKKVLENEAAVPGIKEKTESISLNHWESITLYQLVKNQYCDIVDALRSTEATRAVMKDYNKLMDKLETVIGKTSEYDEG